MTTTTDYSLDMAECIEEHDGIRYALIIHPEDVSPEGNASAIDEETDAAILEEIRGRLDRGDLWAWCVVECRAVWNGFRGSDFLGGCSYRDSREFRQEGGYWPDMKAEALGMLRSEITFTRARIANLPEALR